MRLWTIQNPDVVASLESTGVYRADTVKLMESRILAPEVPPGEDYTLNAYHWLVRMMGMKIGDPPTGVEYPVWAWRWYGGRAKPKPDLRNAGYGPRGAELVRLELEVDDSRVLLSDFSLWWFPYSCHYLPHPPGSDVKFLRDLKAAGLEECPHPWKPLPEPFRSRMEKSWEYVFDLSSRRTSLTNPMDKKCVQATMWEIRSEWVREIKKFRSR